MVEDAKAYRYHSNLRGESYTVVITCSSQALNESSGHVVYGSLTGSLVALDRRIERILAIGSQDAIHSPSRSLTPVARFSKESDLQMLSSATSGCFNDEPNSLYKPVSSVRISNCVCSTLIT